MVHYNLPIWYPTAQALKNYFTGQAVVFLIFIFFLEKEWIWLVLLDFGWKKLCYLISSHTIWLFIVHSIALVFTLWLLMNFIIWSIKSFQKISKVFWEQDLVSMREPMNKHVTHWYTCESITSQLRKDSLIKNQGY